MFQYQSKETDYESKETVQYQSKETDYTDICRRHYFECFRPSNCVSSSSVTLRSLDWPSIPGCNVLELPYFIVYGIIKKKGSAY